MIETMEQQRPDNPAEPRAVVGPDHRPPDWEVIDVRIARPSWPRLLFIRLLGRFRHLLLARRFRRFGAGSRLARPNWVRGAESIEIGERVTIWSGARMTAVNPDPSRTLITIGEGTSLHPNVHISGARQVSIGRRVLVAANCYITDHDHDWLDPEDPIRFNSRLLATPTRIGDDCWLGEKVAVLRGVTIGRGCIIGAHSVVTRDLPERTVAVGAPARVIRRWDDKIGGWVAVGSAD